MKQMHVLLAEDNEGDILLTREALEEAKLIVQLTVVKDGKEAIDFLDKEGNYPDATLPDILLLDINLPKRNGHEVLRYIKGNDRLKHIPVIMLTTSSSEKDVELCYNNYANCFITKPVDVNDFLRVIASVVNFWMNTARLPAKKNYPPDIAGYKNL